MASDEKRPRSYLISGPKGSGKSSFAKLLVNSILSQQLDFPGSPAVAFLDLDPGQPEFQPPGSISLMLLKSFVLSAQFTHDTTSVSSKSKIIRSHFFGYLTPRDDPSYYLECCMDLLNNYRKIQSTDTCANSPIPLVINCCGWVFGTGLDILVDLICRLLPSRVIYMSTQGPEEVEARLAGIVSTSSNLFHTLTSQPFQHTTQDSSKSRLVKMLSYFHQRCSLTGFLRWEFPALQLSELSSFPYAGEKQLIHGIMILGDETDLNCVAALIENSILGIVLVEDGNSSEEFGLSSRLSIGHVTKSQVNECITQGTQQIDMENALDHQAQQFEATWTGRSRIIHTPEQIPCLQSRADGQRPFEPKKLRGVGQMLIHKVNQHSCSFEAATPVSQESFDHWCKLGLKIMLVRGQLDVPTWTYSEHFATSLAKQATSFQSATMKDNVHGNLINKKGGPISYSMYDIDPLEYENGHMGVTHAASTARFESKAWRSRKNLRYLGPGSDTPIL